MRNVNLSKKGVLLACIGLASVMLTGCSDNSKPKSPAPNFDDGSPTLPVTSSGASNIPEPMGWNKGSATGAIEVALNASKDDFDVNQKLKLKSLLSGYYNFDNYVIEARVRDDGVVKKLYAKTGRYDPQRNVFTVDVKDVISSEKKSLIV